MQNFPHHYHVSAAGGPADSVALTAAELPPLASAPPREFGGPGTRWSPETLLVAAVADCFILTFRAIARASAMRWTSLDCNVTGTLDKIERSTQFTHFDVHVLLTIPPDVDAVLARRLLEKAERGCLVSNSLKAEVHLDAAIDFVDEPAAELAER